MKIVGLREEIYVGQTVKQIESDFIYSPADFKKHIICVIEDSGRKLEIELSHSEGECGSGCTTATWGNMRIKKVSNFKGFNYIPKNEIVVPDIISEEGDVSNKVFNVTHNGGDNYYPCGGYSVNLELFEKTARAKDKRPVWIFEGASGVGKSYLASQLERLESYETDSNPDLPKVITASIVVVGNKYKFKLEDIVNRLFGEVEVILVEFYNA